MLHLQDRIAAALARLGVTAADRVGVACSGGPDSAVLGHAALALHRRGSLGPVTLLHVDHGLRPGSARDGDVVTGLAQRWGGQVALLTAEVARDQASLEAAARHARYAALDRAASELGLRWVLLAHTASDQAETVVMRLLRGTGVPGLAAIPRARGIYLRPLLDTTRAEVEQYRAAFEVPAVADPMNQDPAFLRNRVRHTWLPGLRRENPRLDEALCRLADAARQEREVLDYAAAALLDGATRRAVRPESDATWSLDVRTLAAAPAAVARRALALAAERAGGRPLEARHQQAVHALVCQPTAGTTHLDLPGAVAVREYDILRFELAGPHFGVAGARARASQASQAAERPHMAQGAPGAPGAARIAVAGPQGPYTVRCWQPGDRMRPARLKGKSRKLSDLFIDAKVPRSRRAEALVVTRAADGVIEWAEHIGPAFQSTVSVSLTIQEPVASNKVSD